MKGFKDYLPLAGRISEDLTKKKKYSVVRYDAPNSGKVTHSTVIHAANKTELHGHVRNWMDSIGLDPNDEDDHAHINITAK